MLKLRDTWRIVFTVLFLLFSDCSISLASVRAVKSLYSVGAQCRINLESTDIDLISPKVKALGPMVGELIAAGGYPWPVEYILAIIQSESGGNIGEVNPKSGASGLMQIMPIALKQFNIDTKLGYTMVDMKGKDDQSARRQVRVGLHIVGYMWRQAANYLKKRVSHIVFEDLVQISQLFYVAGQGAAKKKIDEVVEPTFAKIADRFAGWSAIPYTKRIWSDTASLKPVWDLDAVERWIGGSAGSGPDRPAIARTGKNGFLIGVLAIAIASFFLRDRIS